MEIYITEKGNYSNKECSGSLPSLECQIHVKFYPHTINALKIMRFKSW